MLLRNGPSGSFGFLLGGILAVVLMIVLFAGGELGKKKVNLYEPVVIHTENNLQPVQIVVNHIDKNVVRGYVSAAKYKSAEIVSPSASTANPADGAARAAVHGPQPPQ